MKSSKKERIIEKGELIRGCFSYIELSEMIADSLILNNYKPIDCGHVALNGESMDYKHAVIHLLLCPF